MLVYRWQAPLYPSKEQARMIFLTDELNPREEILTPDKVYPEHRHPFDEMRMILEGELAMTISGNQLLLRTGDRIMIPANTKHSQRVLGNGPCLCLVANRPF